MLLVNIMDGVVVFKLVVLFRLPIVLFLVMGLLFSVFGLLFSLRFAAVFIVFLGHCFWLFKELFFLGSLDWLRCGFGDL